MFSRLKLDGKISLITGAGSGVGRAMANLFSKNGSKVIVVDVIAERVKQVTSEIGSSNAIGMVHDLSKKLEVEKMIDETLSSQGRIDILCNNAGIMDGVTPVADVTDELWERVLNINLNAPFWATRRVIPKMIEQGGGVIINTGSIAGFTAGKSGTPYTVSKHGLIGLTKSTAVFYGGKGIRCNAMVLGAAETAIGLGTNAPNAAGLDVLMKKGMATLPRTGKPEEIANLALFLASDDSSFVNGSCIVIDAGWSAFWDAKKKLPGQLKAISAMIDSPEAMMDPMCRLSHLAECDWIEAQGINGAKRFRLKLSNPRTASFLKFLREVNYFSES